MRRAFVGNYGITRQFGVYDAAYSRYPESRHPGTDYGTPANTQLVAGMSGHVTVYDRDASIKTGRGKEVVITNGASERKACHMNRITVANGAWVREGDPIGLSGNTGYVLPAPTAAQPHNGAHLHDELKINGTYVPLEDHLNEGGEMIENEAQNDLVFLVALGRHAGHDLKGNRVPNENESERYIGKSWEFALNDILKNSDRTGRVDLLLRSGGQVNRDTALAYITKNLS